MPPVLVPGREQSLFDRHPRGKTMTPLAQNLDPATALPSYPSLCPFPFCVSVLLEEPPCECVMSMMLGLE